MTTLWVALGVVIVGVGAADVFLTTLHDENRGRLLAVPSYRAMWRLARALTAPLPHRWQAQGRSLVGPAMVLTTIGGWLGLQVLGFALLYYPAIGHGDFDTGRAGHSFGTALYFSVATLTSLSFSDVQPHSLAYHALAAAETLVGLGTLTVAISYLLDLYRVLQDQGVLSSVLLHHSGGDNDPAALLRPHFIRGRDDDLGTLVRQLDQSLTEHREGMRRYPLVWFFHTRRPYRALPYTFWFIGAAAAALRWGLPEDHPVTRDPWLPGLITGYDDVVATVAARFLPRYQPPSVEWVSEDRFLAAVDGAADDDTLLARFLEIEGAMCAMAEIQPEEDRHRRYRRYQQWASFACRGRGFVRAASAYLALEPPMATENPRRARY